MIGTRVCECAMKLVGTKQCYESAMSAMSKLQHRHAYNERAKEWNSQLWDRMCGAGLCVQDGAKSGCQLYICTTLARAGLDV